MTETPRTDQRAFKAAFLPPEAIVTADFARELEQELAQRTAELAALKAQRDPLAEMWAALAEYQPQAYANGYGMCWMRMCEERTRAAAADAANPFVNSSAAARAAARAAAGAAAYFEEAMKSAADAVVAIRRAKEAKP
jgi:hypothetical protein